MSEDVWNLVIQGIQPHPALIDGYARLQLSERGKRFKLPPLRRYQPPVFAR